jgi:hypothetical protein
MAPDCEALVHKKQRRGRCVSRAAECGYGRSSNGGPMPIGEERARFCKPHAFASARPGRQETADQKGDFVLYADRQRFCDVLQRRIARGRR